MGWLARRSTGVLVLAVCALAVSVGSWIVFPRSFTYFGILHSIAVASVLAWPFVDRPRTAFAIGCIVIVAGLTWSHPAFDARGLSWIGFTATKPATEDYVPLAPWAGIVFVGIALGHRLDRGASRARGRRAAARVVPDSELLVRHPEDDLGADHEPGQPDGMHLRA